MSDETRETSERKRLQKRARVQAAKGKDITGLMRGCFNPERRESTRLNLRLFLETYFPDVFYLDWSPDHLLVIQRIETSVLKGGLFAMAMPRGQGKTAISICASKWVVLHAHCRFPVIVGATAGHAENSLETIKTFLTSSPLLIEDFPEVCIPFQALEGIAQRASGQTCGGVSTDIKMGKDRLIFPYIEDENGDPYPTSGIILVTTGLTGSIRGLQHTTPSGEIMRPDFTVIDDPQTDESANSVSQTHKRERLINKAVLGLAGVGRKMRGIMPCTIIHRDDLAAKILDKKISPRWRGECFKMLKTMPKNLEAWEEYKDVYINAFKSEPFDHKTVNEYYLEHREFLDFGAEASWDKRKEPEEISAIQHAMHLYLDDEDSFYSEYQNDPKENEGASKLTVADILKKVSGYERSVIPQQCSDLTAFIDVQGDLFWSVVTAWDDDASGHIIEYGAFPEQKEKYYTNAKAVKGRRSLSKAYPKTTDLEGKLFAGLWDHCDEIMRDRYRDDGVKMKVKRLLIDAGWGMSTQTVYRFVRQYNNPAVMAYMGVGIGASARPMVEYKRVAGERNWDHARKSRVKDQPIFRIDCDVNYWKTDVTERLALPVGSRGGITLYKGGDREHRMVAEQFTAEHPVMVKSATRTVSEWKHIDKSRDNHLFDGIVGCACAADMEGIKTTKSQKDDKITKGERLRRQKSKRIKYHN